MAEGAAVNSTTLEAARSIEDLDLTDAPKLGRDYPSKVLLLAFTRVITSPVDE